MYALIKGINKQILEVTNTESPYFEKIIFFVRPSSNPIGEKALENEAKKIACQVKKPPKERKTAKQLFSGAFYVFLGAGAGCALSFLLSAVL